MLFPRVGFVCIYSVSRFLMQVKKYFAVPALIFCSCFVQLFFTRQLICLQFFEFYFSRLLQFFCSQIYSYFSHFFQKGYDNLLTIFPSIIFFFFGVIPSLSTVMFAILLKCAVLCSGYTKRLSHSLWQLSIQVYRSRFVARNSFVSELNDSNISLIWLVDISCATHACLKDEVQNFYPIRIY